MAERMLVKDVTHYGDTSQLNKTMYNESSRSIQDYKKMNRHPMIHLGLSILKLNLADIVPVYEGESEKEVEITRAVFEPIWKRLVSDAAEMLDFGWKTFEIRYDYGTIKYKDAEGTSQTFNGLLLKQPRSLDGETVDVLLNETDGSFRGFWQDYDEARTCLAEDGKALLFTNNLSSGNYYGISELEYVYTYWFDSTLERQFYMRWLERKGMGTYVGFHPTGKDEDGTDNSDIMLTLLDNIIEGTHVAIPHALDAEGNQTWRIEMLEPGDKTDAFIMKAQYNNEMILRGLVIPDQALTQNQTGSYASTEVYMNSLIERKQDILNRVVDNINRYMVQKYVEFAFGPDVDVSVRAGKLDDATKQVALEITKKLVESGTKKPVHDWLSEQSGIPLEEEEEEEELPVLDPRLDPNVDNVLPLQQKEKFSDGGFSQLEDKINFDEFSKSLDMYEAEFKNNMQFELEKQEDRVKKFITANYDKKFNRPLEFAKDIQIFVSPIKKIFRDYMTNTYDYSYEIIRASVEGKLSFSESSKDFINFRINNVVSKFVTDLQNSLQYTVANAMTTNMALNSIFEKVTGLFKGFTINRVPNIAATETGSIIALSTTDYIADNLKRVKSKLLDPKFQVQRVQSSAIMDDSTTELCASLNGVVVAVDSPIYQQYPTPRHYQCRSVWIPISKDEIRDLGIEGTGISTYTKGKPYTEKTIISDKLRGSATQQLF